MRPARSLSAVLAAALLVVLGGVLSSPPPVHPQTPDVWLNIIGQAKKINIAIPDFTLVSGTKRVGGESRLRIGWAEPEAAPPPPLPLRRGLGVIREP